MKRLSYLWTFQGKRAGPRINPFRECSDQKSGSMRLIHWGPGISYGPGLRLWQGSCITALYDWLFRLGMFQRRPHPSFRKSIITARYGLVRYSAPQIPEFPKLPGTLDAYLAPQIGAMAPQVLRSTIALPSGRKAFRFQAP